MPLRFVIMVMAVVVREEKEEGWGWRLLVAAVERR
jgi:hypothetical protein